MPLDKERPLHNKLGMGRIEVAVISIEIHRHFLSWLDVTSLCRFKYLHSDIHIRLLESRGSFAVKDQRVKYTIGLLSQFLQLQAGRGLKQPAYCPVLRYSF